ADRARVVGDLCSACARGGHWRGAHPRLLHDRGGWRRPLLGLPCWPLRSRERWRGRRGRRGACPSAALVHARIEPMSRDIARPAYAELQVTTNFSFLRGGSHPHELVAEAKALGLSALAITDRNTLAGVV